MSNACHYMKGSDLCPEDKEEVFRCYRWRSTIGNHRPGYRPQFKDDAEWLENTIFHVTKDQRLDFRFCTCESTPTWPEGINPL